MRLLEYDGTPYSLHLTTNLFIWKRMEERTAKCILQYARNNNCYTSFTHYLYGLPKIHKPNIPIHPIINYKSSLLFKLSRFLSSLLKPFTVDSPLSINSPCQFSNDLKN